MAFRRRRGAAATDLTRVLSTEDLQQQHSAQRLRLRGRYGFWLLLLLGAQLVAVNVFMFMYACWGVNWNVPNPVIQTWLAATVVELIGLVYVIVSHLFPSDSSN
jgi:hypothetical protein